MPACTSSFPCRTVNLSPSKVTVRPFSSLAGLRLPSASRDTNTQVPRNLFSSSFDHAPYQASKSSSWVSSSLRTHRASAVSQ